jgi:hypothetical protein
MIDQAKAQVDKERMERLKRRRNPEAEDSFDECSLGAVVGSHHRLAKAMVRRIKSVG